MKEKNYMDKILDIYSNPFQLGTCARGAGFYNRKKELQRIYSFIFSTGQYNMLLVGQRRIGKTSLLRKIQDKIQVGEWEHMYPVYYDLQDKSHVPLGHLLTELAEKISLELEKKLVYTKEKLRNPNFFINTYSKSLTDLLNGKDKVLFLFDEFDVISSGVNILDNPYDNLSYNRFIPFIAKWIEVIQDQNMPIKFIFAAGRNYKDLKQERYGALTKFGIKLELNYFAKEDIEELIHDLSGDVLPFNRKAIDSLYEITAGHPFFTQALAGEAFNQAVFQKQKTVTEKQIQTGYEEAIKSVAGGIEWFWGSFSAKQKVFLYILTQLIDENSDCSVNNIRQKADSLHLLPGLENPEETIRELVNARILQYGKDNKLCSGFIVPFFQKWIKQEVTIHEITDLLDKIYDGMDATLKLGRLNYNKGNYEKALNFFEEVLEQNPIHFESLYKASCSVMNLYHQSKQDTVLLSKAIKYMKEAYRFSPEFIQENFESLILEIIKNPEVLEREKLNLENIINSLKDPGKSFLKAYIRSTKGEKAFIIPLLNTLEQSDISMLFEQEDFIPEWIIKKGKKALLEFLTMNDVSIIHELGKNLGIKFQQVDSLFNENDYIKENAYVLDNNCIVEFLIYNQKLICFPLEILQLKNLKHLSIINCGLPSIPKTLVQLADLQELILSDNILSTLPENLKHLTILGLGQNQISDISFLKGFTQLTALHLHTNQIIEISSLHGLTQLITLNLGGNKISNISPLQNFTQLTTLGLGKNQINDISPLSGLIQLTKLHLHANQISDISSLKSLTQLTTLNLGGNKISDISPLQNLTQLTTLGLGKNQINDISSLSGLIQLTKLHLHANQISDIFPLKNLTQLITLNVGSNKISDISLIKDCTQIATLKLYDNQIKDISPLKGLNQLTTLHLGDNLINDISSLKNHTKLTNLFLGGNQISSISPLRKLTQLVTVSLNYNKISQLPPWVIDRNFRIKNNYSFEEGFFSIRNNPLSHPPLEVVEKGHDAIVRFFKELEEKGQDYLYEAKLILVGEGGVGKTTFRMKLENPDVAMPTNEQRTRGIDIVKYSFKNEDNKTINVNIWDFGGQDIYYATHRFFLTHRSFYVLMTDTRRQDDNFDYWIPNIQLFAGDSPILVVKNLMEGFQRHISIGNFLYGEKFNITERIFDVNLKDNTGLAELKKAIHYYIQHLPHIGQALPATWVKIREVVETIVKKQNVISFERFKDVCIENHVPDTEKIHDLGKYFHDLGIILWYHNIPLLKSKVILNPNWATNAVYLLIDDRSIQNQHGLFTKEDAARVWGDKMYCDMKDELIELMKAFRLCYQQRKRKEYIIPSLLPPDPAKAVCWDNADNLRLHFHYEFMPKGIVNQLTAELYRYIQNAECVWASGVILEDKQTQAKVEEVRNSRILRINVRGKDARGFLRLIMESLEEIHETYPGIEVSRQVPCQCAACINNPEPTIFSYDKLIRWVDEGKKEVYCNEGGEFLEIEKLLFNVGMIPEKGREEKARSMKVFISYSKADLEYAKILKKILKPFERRGEIAIWWDRDIIPGDIWEDEVKRHLDTAEIILFLISPDFLSTDYIWDIEIPWALKRHEIGKARVIPVILRPCTWEGAFTPFSKLLALPDKVNPITSYENQDDAWLKVLKGIKKVIGSVLDQGFGESDW